MNEGASRLPVVATIVACFVMRPSKEGTQVLLMQRVGAPLHGEWFYVAGGVEEGETAIEAMLREIDEETGMVPEILYSSGETEQFYNSSRNAIEFVPLFVGFVPAGTQVKLNDEHSAHRWLGKDEASALLPFPIQRRLLNLVWQDFVETAPTPLLRVWKP